MFLRQKQKFKKIDKSYFKTVMTIEDECISCHNRLLFLGHNFLNVIFEIIYIF